ncbi:uncharacterized protein LOC118157515 isoform X1 [Oxyura jamaicensis]|uniref:uncharacterized protein LOC118157506 isoform X1 n=1 Tax=Oxyura jamaicensis TaxID=8884 RepID=UPI0015A67AA5|nr:uncharacterized protein LOC118157506 isoform X1 [Oxyura jamaicensis]XP_035167775.1 uncharacterized protein LOC118157515 isoform X1 [Oxyura jamaicensis]
MARRCNHHRGPRFPETHSSESRYRGDMFGHGQPHGKLQAQVSQGFSLHFHFLPLSTLAGLGGDLPLGIWPASAAACSHSDAARAHKEEAAGITVRARWCTTGPPDPLEEKLSPRRAQPPLLLLSTFTRKIHIQGSAPSPLSSRSWMEVQLLTTTLGGAGQWTPIGDPPNKAIPWLDAGRCAPMGQHAKVVELLRQDHQRRDLQAGSPVASPAWLARGVRTTWSTRAGEQGRGLGVLFVSVALPADNLRGNSE